MLVEALKKIFSADNEIQILGTRHGEKKHEALLSVEERFHAEEMENYFRVSADNRYLNYTKYFEVGEKGLESVDSYTSENTQRLELDSLIELLLGLDYIQSELNL